MQKKTKVGVAIIGCGRVGKTHIEAVRELEDIAVLAAVVDADKNLASETGRNYSVKFYTRTQEAFQDSQIDAVAVCLPHHLHTPVAMEALGSGKHVIVEKPFALSVAEAKRMIQTANQKNLLITAGQSYRFFSGLQEVKNTLKSEIGDPFNMLYTLALRFDKNKAPGWWKYEEKTGGLVFPMLGSHSVDAVLWFFEGKTPERVYAQASSHNPDFEGPDEATIFIRFKDGAMATNYLSLNTSPSKEEGMIVGPKGRIHFRHGDTSEGLVGNASIEVMVGDRMVGNASQKGNNITLEEKNFIESIRGNAEPVVKPEEIILQMKIIEAAKKSAETGHSVEI